MSEEKKLVILVDDSHVNLNVGKSALGDRYNVAAVDSAERLFYVLEKINLNPSVILLDIDMPQMDGFEAIKVLKSKPETKEIPVIFLTSRSEEADKNKGMSLGAVDYIVKPFDPSRLINAIEPHL